MKLIIDGLIDNQSRAYKRFGGHSNPIDQFEGLPLNKWWGEVSYPNLASGLRIKML